MSIPLLFFGTPVYATVEPVTRIIAKDVNGDCDYDSSPPDDPYGCRSCGPRHRCDCFPDWSLEAYDLIGDR